MDSSRDFGLKVAQALEVRLSRHEERDFEDGEHKVRPLDSVRDGNVFVIQSLHSDMEQSVNDKLCRLLFFIGALRDASARSITAVIPYLCYARQDRKTDPGDPVTTRYTAMLFEKLGLDRVITMDVHNLAAFHNAFRCQTEHLEAKSLFIEWLTSNLDAVELIVVSPDAGGMKRAQRFRRELSERTGNDCAIAFMEKQRSESLVSSKMLIGDVKDRVAIIVDDLISTGATLLHAAAACFRNGAKQVYAAATHGLFVGDANSVLSDQALARVLITDTIPPFRLRQEVLDSQVEVLSAAPLFAQTIARLSY